MSQSLKNIPSDGTNTLAIALVQICSSADVEQNCARVLNLIEQAANEGVRWVLLPENVCYIRSEGDQITWSETLNGDVVQWFSGVARQFQIHLLVGSLPEQIPNSEKIYNTSLLIRPSGQIEAVYRKLHLFDAVLPNGRVLNESRFVERGDEIVTGEVDGVKVGLSICYDLRFPELYTALTLMGAEIITVPSAFTRPTGKAHWELLLRTRAIENQVYILAPAQTGEHSASRSSYGHSMVVDPWGTVVAAAEEAETVLMANLDLGLVRSLRQRMPCLTHRRFVPPQVSSQSSKTESDNR